MEIIYEAFNFFKKNGFIHLPHLILMNQDIDIKEIYLFYEKEKGNKEIIQFMDFYQQLYGLKTVKDESYVRNTVYGKIYNLGYITTGECIICYDDDTVGYKTSCDHFMCINCCKKFFEQDYTMKRCPYCRQDVVIYRFNEILNIFQNNREEDHQEEEEQVVPSFYLHYRGPSNFIRGRFVYDD